MSVRLSPDSVRLTALGETTGLLAEAFDGDGAPIPEARIQLRVLDSTVALVDGEASVTAIRNGRTHVVASVGEARDSALVHVEQAVVTLTVIPAFDSIWVLGTGPDLSVRGLDSNGHETPVQGAEWVSSDPSILVVDTLGRVEAVADGMATVAATLDAAVGEATLVVDERGWVSVSLDEFGGGRDRDGYLVALGGDPVPIVGGTSFVVAFVPEGTHTIELSGAADHCLPDAAPTVDVQKGDTATAVVPIRCSGRFAFEDRVPPTYDDQLHYFDEFGGILVLSEEEIVPGEYAWSRDGAWIAFTKTVAGNSDIFIVRPDGTGARRLTFDPSEDIGPTWSPDGSRIAFRRVGVGQGLWVVDVGTGTVERLADKALQAGPSWSPTGEAIVFTAAGALEPWNRELWSIRGDGTGLRQLTTDATGLGYRSVTWSPDGSRFAVARPTDVVWELVVMNADASARAVVATSEQSSFEPSWSPDGMTVVFTKHDGVRYGAYQVRADGTGEVALTPGLDATSATYSYDGTHVLFSWTEVTATNLDGTGLLVLTKTSASSPLPRPGG